MFEILVNHAFYKRVASIEAVLPVVREVQKDYPGFRIDIKSIESPRITYIQDDGDTVFVEFSDGTVTEIKDVV